MKLSKKACKLLADAQASLKKQKGWGKQGYGDFYTLDGQHCAVGALRAACLAEGLTYRDKDYLQAVQAVALAAWPLLEPAASNDARNYFLYESRIIGFNDDKNTRKKDVLSLFCQAMTDGKCKEESK